jgi:hypothetical protein
MNVSTEFPSGWASLDRRSTIATKDHGRGPTPMARAWRIDVEGSPELDRDVLDVSQTWVPPDPTRSGDAHHGDPSCVRGMKPMTRLGRSGMDSSIVGLR